MKKLSKLLAVLQNPYRFIGNDVMISDIVYDSRNVHKGCLFVAIKGFRSDGHLYIPQAIKKGAAALLVDHPVEQDLPQIITEDTRSAMAELSFDLYEQTKPHFKLAGITGTNGKTTITHLLFQLAEKAALSPALIGTLGSRTMNTFHEGIRTTPESADLAKLFNEFSEQAISSVFMEVSSHAIELKRVHGLSFDAALFTNLTQDHLDFHKNMDAYFHSKSKLFDQLGPDAKAIVNIDDPYGRTLYHALKTAKTSYAVDHPDADYHYSELSVDVHGIHGNLKTPFGYISVNAPLLGKFNAENIAGTLACWDALYHGITDLNDVEFRPVAGRMEMLPTSRATAVIDYAHTPDAMEKALKAASELDKRKKIISVFGCGGDRDKAKRPLMGAVADRYSDRIFLTNDNPRHEDPTLITDAICAGIENKKKTEVIIDREKAIRQAWSCSEPGDLLMILGKGAETYMEIKDKQVPFNDKDIIQKLEHNK